MSRAPDSPGATDPRPPMPTADMPLAALGIVGLGLIGTSVALAARHAWPGLRITGVDRPEALGHPTVVGVCDRAASHLGVLGDADVVVLAAPLDAIVAMLPDVRRNVRSDALVIDVAGTKRTIVAAACAAGIDGFVGGHPMAGGARSGPGAARGDLFARRPWFLVRATVGSDLGRAERFVAGLGAVPVRTDAETHDRVMAAVSHLPQIVASTLMVAAGREAGDEGLQWAGPGLRDTTRIAASASAIWEGVLAANRDMLRPLLLRMAGDLTAIANGLDEPSTVAHLFDAANRYRAQID